MSYKTTFWGYFCSFIMNATIIGSGIAGLASSIHLARKGYKVRIMEQSPSYGGKLNTIILGNYRFDSGPSLFTMPHFVTELLDPDLIQKFEYLKLPVLCNYFYPDGSRFQASAQKETFIDEAARFFDEPKLKIERFLNHSKRVYDITSPVFLENSLHKLSTYTAPTGLKGIANLWRLDMFRTMNQALESQFSNPKIIQLFNRYATYNGSNPYKAPATLHVIPHLEFHYGAYLPKKGMREIADILYEQATRLGVTFEFNSRVQTLNSGKVVNSGSVNSGSSGKVNSLKSTQKSRITSVITEEGKEYSSDLVIANVDIKIVYQKFLQKSLPPKIKNAENSSSALIFYWGVKQKFPELDVHNIFFSEDYQEEFDAIFNRKTIQKDPTVYINITSKHVESDAPNYGENWFVMINVPHNSGQNWQELVQIAKGKILQKLSKSLQVPISDIIEEEAILDPITIESNTGSDKGSLYGSSSNHRMSAFFRQANFSKDYDNLYFCGGSVHPGGGIPLCLLGAKIVNKLVPDACG